MEKYKAFLLLAILSLFLSANAQLKYESADSYPLYGKISENTETRYERLPSSLKDITRKPVWGLGKNTAGLYLRFRTNSTSIGLKWKLYQNRMMNHMTEVGIKGFDLYCLINNEWVFVNSGRPKVNTLENEATVISNMDASEKEFLLFFPLYDGVVDLQIGVDQSSTLRQPLVNSPISSKPIISYGTSILQGGCASRPGMAHSNILVRKLNREFVNLGFSGNGQLDYEIAEIIGDREASLIILDFMPNVTVKQIEERLETFYKIVRKKAPNTTLLFVENPNYPTTAFDLQGRKAIDEKNATLHKVFNKMVSNGDDNIFLVSSLGMIGVDNEATVDGTHFTDLGFMRYAEYLYPYIKKYMKE